MTTINKPLLRNNAISTVLFQFQTKTIYEYNSHRGITANYGVIL